MEGKVMAYFTDWKRISAAVANLISCYVHGGMRFSFPKHSHITYRVAEGGWYINHYTPSNEGTIYPGRTGAMFSSVKIDENFEDFIEILEAAIEKTKKCLPDEMDFVGKNLDHLLAMARREVKFATYSSYLDLQGKPYSVHSR